MSHAEPHSTRSGLPHGEQMAFPYGSLDFPGRTTVTLDEAAAKLGCSVGHLLAECEHGALVGLDLRGAKATRRFVRVPIEAYRAYIIARMTGPFRKDFIRDLPRHVQEQLLGELREALKTRS